MFKLALIQSAARWNPDPAEKETTRKNAGRLIREAARNGADIVSLSEMWICPYAVDPMRRNAEEKGGPTYRFLSDAAKENGIWLIGGTISVREGDRYYNTCYVFDPAGREAACHRKNHLFGINVPGKMTFSEASFFTPGDGPTLFETPFAKIGVAVCFDVRFRDPIEREALLGADLIVLPASFGFVTGEAHWDMLIRSRAVENQIFFAGNCAAADPDETVPYRAWGHSVVYDPWGDCLGRADFGEEILYADIDLGRIAKSRERLPVMTEKLRIDAERTEK